MKARHPRYEHVPEDLEFTVTLYCLSKRLCDINAKKMKAASAALIKELLKRADRRLALCGREFRLVKKNTIRARPLSLREFQARVDVEVEIRLRDSAIAFLLAQQKYEARAPDVLAFGEIIMRHMASLGVRAWECAGWELRCVKKNTLRCRIIGPIQYPQAFRDE